VRLAAVFPGQGSFAVGCTAAWREDDPDGVLTAVSEAAGLDVIDEGEREDTGRSTRRGQPVLLAASLASWSALVRAGVRPLLVAGHSLGEYAAASAAGVLSVPAVARIVAARGRAMADACTTAPGGMAAVVRLAPDDVAALVAEVEGLTAANDNSPGQVVVSGDADALARARALVDARGGRFMPLDVEGPFHSASMVDTVAPVRAAAAAERTADPDVPVVSGSLVRALRTAAEVVASLVDGILAPVRWREVQLLLAREGVTDLVEVGPGRVLAGLAKRTVPELRVHSAATPEDVRELAGALAASGAGTGAGPGA
jgi:[acyl-carrier-protein] S-malonyltransferase